MMLGNSRRCVGKALLMFVATLALLASVAGGAQGGGDVNLVLTSVDASRFPEIYVRARVTDADGNVIPNLTAAHFELTEQSELETQPVVQTINVSTVEEEDNVVLTLTIDRSGSMSGQPMIDAREAAKIMVDLLAPEDRAAVISFASSVRIDQGLTGNKQALKDAIDGLLASGMTALYRAIEDSINELVGEPGIPAVLAFTDGRNNQSPHTPDGAIALAQEHSIPVYTIGLGSVDHGVLESIAAETGGTFHHTPDSSELEDIYRQISAEIGEQCLLVYRTHNEELDGTTRTIEVQVTVAGVTALDTISYIAAAPPAISLTQETRDLMDAQQPAGGALTIAAEITSDVGVQEARVFYRTRGDEHYEDVPMSSAGGAIFSAQVPGGAVQDSGVDFYIVASDGTLTSSSPKSRPAREPHQIAVFPNEKPIITHFPVETASLGQDIQITATVTEDAPHGPLDEVALFFRPSDEVLYRKELMTITSSFSAIIPGSVVTDVGVDYYIVATDIYGVSGYSGTPEEPHHVEIDLFGFVIGRDNWKFSNNDRAYEEGERVPIMWPPSWYSQFDYSAPEYPLSWRFFASPEDFPDWQLFRAAFGDEACYLNPPPGLIIYNPIAVLRWRAIKGEWGGSCFGFAVSCFLFFDGYLDVENTFPGSADELYYVPHDDQSRLLINKYQLYQFGRENQRNTEANMSTTANETLDLVREILESPTGDSRVLRMGFMGQGHAVNPYRIEQDALSPELYYIYVYDNNDYIFPPTGQTIIIIDTNANTWEYPHLTEVKETDSGDSARVPWSGTTGMWLRPPSSVFASPPTLSLGVASPTDPVSAAQATFMPEPGSFEVWVPDCGELTLSAPDGTELVRLDETDFWYSDDVLSYIPGPIGSTGPLGYHLEENGFYELDMSVCPADDRNVTVFSSHGGLDVTDLGTSETIRMGVSANGFRLINTKQDPASYEWALLLPWGEGVGTARSGEHSVASGSSTEIWFTEDGHVHIANYSAANQAYDFELHYADAEGERSVPYGEIQITGNTSHTLVADWAGRLVGPLVVYVDEGMDGEIDETIVLDPLDTDTVSEEAYYPWDVSFYEVKVFDYQVFDPAREGGETPPVSMRLLDGRFQPVTTYRPGDQIYLEVTDYDQNEDSRIAERISARWDRGVMKAAGELTTDPDPVAALFDGLKVFLHNPVTGVTRGIDLQETGPNTGVFRSTTGVTVRDLGGRENHPIVAFYQDPSNHSDIATKTVRIRAGDPAVPDPVAVAFDRGQYSRGDTGTITVIEPQFAGQNAITGEDVLVLKDRDDIVVAAWDELSAVNTDRFAVTFTVPEDVPTGTIRAVYTHPTDPGRTGQATAQVVVAELEDVTGVSVEPAVLVDEVRFGIVAEPVGAIADRLTVQVYDLTGRKVDEISGTNTDSVSWMGGNLRNSAYVYVAVAEGPDGGMWAFRGFVYINR